MNEIPLSHILFVSTGLFFLGVYGFFTRRNLITMLMAVELILNSVNINFVAFNKYLYPGKLDGIFFTLFIITIAAAEAAVGALRPRERSSCIHRHRIRVGASETRDPSTRRRSQHARPGLR